MKFHRVLPILILLLQAATAAASTYTVKPGDTLLRLAWQYSLSPDAIRSANHLASDRLTPGQQIILPSVSSESIPFEAPRVEKAQPFPQPGRAEPAEPTPVSIQRATPVAMPPPAIIPEPAPVSGHAEPPPVSSLHDRLLAAAQNLAAQHIAYNQPWTPPGQPSPWRMDCSNTARYLYMTAAGVDLGRTASDQYDTLRRRHRAWPVPMDNQRLARVDALRNLLKAGDLLFWENTYRPERSSPITHVMIFLGEDDTGHWIMAGSRGHHAGGPNIYPFDPHQSAGGYSFFFGLIHHTGRFIAFGRPL